MSSQSEFIALEIAVMTVSDSRTLSDDGSGDTLIERLTSAGHRAVDRKIVVDNKYKIRETASAWIANDDIQVIISTGGTGLTGRDVTPEAFSALFDKPIEGFGEMFRSVSCQHIKSSTIQSRALAGIANGTVIFCLPGSPGACRDGWDHIICYQLDINHKPCNLVELRDRFRES